MSNTMLRRKLTTHARNLRRNETDAEKKLWHHLRNRKFNGWKFRRQVPYGPFILDFYCPEAKLAIEVDGAQHADERADQDRERTSYLKTQGITVIRFWNRDVLTNIDGVRDHIHAALGQTAAPSPGVSRRPLPDGER